jgi:1-acyl-sn-glycerol-3-phosphate acyltransferase
LSGWRQWLASIAFTSYMFLSVPFYAPVLVACAPFGHRVRYAIARRWVDSVLAALRLLCRLEYVVEGREHLPADSAVILMKHSSTWETLAQLQIFPRQTWVLKRELVWTPFLGWVLPLLKPIAIDRKGGKEAVQQVVAQGKARLEEGLWIVIFPEGTRVPAGQTRRYGLSGAVLAVASGCPVVPVAHNAGDYWPRRGWLKRAGTIRVVIGPPIETKGREPRQVIAETQEWIETQLARIGATASQARRFSGAPSG